MQNILVGILIAGIGSSIIYFALDLVQLFGEINWAVKKLGSTKNFYLVFGMFVVFLGFLFVFGVFNLQDVSDASDQSFQIDSI